MMTFDVSGLAPRLRAALEDLSKDGRFVLAAGGVKLIARESASASLSFDGIEAVLTCGRPHEFFFLFARLLEKGERCTPFSENFSARYSDLSFMLDCSRNKVMRPDEVRRLIRMLAQLGYNALHLYMEDTFELPGYPYFGYLRGGYSADELRALDAYAQQYGMELVPSIQTLAHFTCALRWNAHRDMLDLQDILLAGEEKTYVFIEAMLKQLSEIFTTRTINIGMDEAYLLGFGEYRKRHGFPDQGKIMEQHLERVCALCEKYGFRPMMWADMFFRIAGDGSYESSGKVDLAGIRIPDNVLPIYWDYGSRDPAIYNERFQTLSALRSPCAFAGGAWKWSGVVPGNNHSLTCSKIALDCAEQNGIETVMLTGWGDDGDPGSVYSVLPVIAYYGARQYGGEDWQTPLSALLGFDASLLLMLDEVNAVGRGEGEENRHAPFRYALYGDPLCGVYDRHIAKGDGAQYAQLGDRLTAAGEKAGFLKYLFETEAALCRVLAKKAEAGLLLREAYLAGDRAMLRQIADDMLRPAVALTETLRAIMRDQWFREAKGPGFEAVDIRVAGVAARLESAAIRVDDYLEGRTDRIEELEAPRLTFEPYMNDDPARHAVWAGPWRSIVTAGSIW